MAAEDGTSPDGPGGPAGPVILDYGHDRPRVWGERVALAFSALVTGTIGLVIAVALVEFEILNWPSFGVALAAVPIGCIAAAFLLVSTTAVRAIFQEGERPPRGRTVSSSPTE